MNKLYYIFVTLLLISSIASAKDITCNGEIIFLMADHSGCTDTSGMRQLAFKTRKSSNPWMCAKTELGSSMLLAAKSAKKSIQVYISDQGQNLTCETLPNYSKVSYIIMYE